MAEQPSASEPYVFISYASPDRERALSIADALTASGIRVWLDRRDIVGGSSWDAAIVLAIRSCTVMAVLCSAIAMESPNILQVLRLAQQNRKPVLLLLLEAVIYPPAVEYILTGRQWVELGDQPRDAWLPNVLRGLGALGMTPSGPASAAGTAAPADRPRTTLPQSLSSFVGREREIDEVTRHLTATRLLTLTGPGGVGKTRLAVEVARAVSQHFADGAMFVELTPVSDAALVPARIAQVLGVQASEGEDASATLAAFLQEKDLLLVLDNYEQVLDAAPRLAELISASRLVQAIVTSRVVLRVRGEQEFVVPPLAPPNLDGLLSLHALVQNASVQLFAQRAQVVSPGFAVTESNARAVCEICRHLDGLPLAIELAAARIKVLSPQAMLARLQHRLELLRGGARDLPARQQTLRTTIDWSYELLEPEEQTLFRRLAVFVGGCTLAATESVCVDPNGTDVDVLEGVASLVDKSLLRREDGADGEPRFTMFETIREYALERLAASGEMNAVRLRHALVYLGLAEEAMPHFSGPRQLTWLTRLETEHDNLRAALQWWEESDNLEQLVRMADALTGFWLVRGHLAEARARMARVLHAPGSSGPSKLRAAALLTAGNLAFHHVDFASAHRFYTEALQIHRALGIIEVMDAEVLHAAGIVSLAVGDYMAARTYLEETVRVRREHNNQLGLAAALNDLANLAHEQRDYTAARSLFEQSLAIFRALGAANQVAFALSNLAIVAQRNYWRARCTSSGTLGTRPESPSRWIGSLW